MIGKTENQFSLTQVSPSRRGAQNQISVSNTSLLLLLALVVLAAIPRIVATHNDLWLDEIVSVQKVRTLASPWEIFTSIHRDNNHHLNSLYLYLVRNTSYDPTFRYFSVLCGLLTVLAGYWTAVPRGKRMALLFATFIACSYPLIHFSSEARGYSAMILGSVVALGSALRWMEKPSIAMELLYGVAISFALLSHLTVCLVWGSLAVVGFCDYVVRPRLVGRGETTSTWLTLVAIFGGIKLFGAVGLLLGPLLTGLAASVLRLYERTRRFRLGLR